MTASPGIRGVRWGLPWIGLMAVSTSLAYAMNVLVGGGMSAPGVESNGSAPATLDASCDSRGGAQYIGLNTWIPTLPESKRCHELRAAMVTMTDRDPVCQSTAAAALADGDDARARFLADSCGPAITPR